MASNERIKKYLDAGTVLGQVTRARAEEIVRELASAGDIQREQAQEWVDNLVERSRKTSEQILELVRHEVSAQLSKIDSASLETLAGQVADLLKRSADAGRSRHGRRRGPGARKVARQGAQRQGAEKARRRGQEDGAARRPTAKRRGRRPRRPPPRQRRRHAHSSSGPRPRSRHQDGAGQEGTRAKKAPPRRPRRADRPSPRHTRVEQLSAGSRRRLDTELVRRGLVANRHEAQAAIAAGIVLVAGRPGRQGGTAGGARRAHRARARRQPFVSRGGQKLDAALTRFAVAPHGRRVLDAGASTGGFTDCLLQRGAAHVYAVDVGHGQLDQRLRSDQRVDACSSGSTCAR